MSIKQLPIKQGLGVIATSDSFEFVPFDLPLEDIYEFLFDLRVSNFPEKWEKKSAIKAHPPL